jgi:hypothetical protein
MVFWKFFGVQNFVCAGRDRSSAVPEALPPLLENGTRFSTPVPKVGMVGAVTESLVAVIVNGRRS